MELAKDIILALGKGALLLSMPMAPNSGRMFEIFGKDFISINKKKYQRSERIKRAVKRLKRNRLVEIYDKQGKTVVELTENGKKRLLVYQLDNLVLPRPKTWDHYWRFVIFDIPETKKRARHALVGKLRELGFMCLQKSVWVTPYACKDEIDFISEILEISNFIIYIEAKYVDDEEKLKLHFSRTLNKMDI